MKISRDVTGLPLGALGRGGRTQRRRDAEDAKGDLISLRPLRLCAFAFFPSSPSPIFEAKSQRRQRGLQSSLAPLCGAFVQGRARVSRMDGEPEVAASDRCRMPIPAARMSTNFWPPNQGKAVPAKVGRAGFAPQWFALPLRTYFRGRALCFQQFNSPCEPSRYARGRGFLRARPW